MLVVFISLITSEIGLTLSVGKVGPTTSSGFKSALNKSANENIKISLI